MYKYTTMRETSGYYRDHQFMRCEQVASFINNLKHTKSEIFATIQDYDEDGNVIGCPLYFDIDSPTLMEAYSDATSLYYDLWADYDVKPALHFSGSKGFHITLPLYVRHPRCHEIVEMIAKDYGLKCLDYSVYSSRRMWRCDKTYNTKGKSWKTRTHEEEPFSRMIDRSRNNLHLDNWPTVKVKDLPIDAYIERLPDRSNIISDVKGTETIDMPMCMVELWGKDTPPKGQAHHLANVIVRWCYKSGLEPDEVIALFESHKFWSGVNPADYRKIIKSVYTTGNAGVGCKNGKDANLLQPYCNVLCPFVKGYGEVS